jgi:hypothetical protein
MKITIKAVLKYILFCILGLVLIAVVGIWWLSPLPPLLDDGPFYGKEANESQKGTLKQDFPIQNGMHLKVYSNSIENSPPVVQLMAADSSVKWSIIPLGYDKTTVSDIEFTNYDCSPFLLACNISGYVTWTFGKERMNWHIYKWGGLRGYYYSW